MDVVLVKLLLLSLLGRGIRVCDDLVGDKGCELERGLVVDMNVVNVNVCRVVAGVCDL